ncbi:LytTR family transcriptional regulator [Hoeflea halophila]|uniref:LytTR family transcriptional regulator n=1 Tax=Hoeflea halophila TaxID=714899 RepID=A0A286I052_9HYPH|nr:LytTR family DNA-binding domain-containing protein [Hoeflea halophila]SOE13441.1 LytTR family transcriptional regulator [Hoeflea halophila]
MSAPLLQSTLRELHTHLKRPRLWLVFALVVGLFVITGPFGTYERLAFPTRLGYWLVLHAASWACALTSIAFFDTLLAARMASRLNRMLIGAIVSAPPLGLVISVINFALLMRPLNAMQIAENALIALPIGVTFSLLAWLSMSSGEPDAPAGPGEATATTPGASSSPGAIAAATDSGVAADRPSLLDRLPVEKRGTLIRLEVQDHYVLVVTTRGEELILMRLADAIAEAGAGQQIHRSHWVSDAGVETLSRKGGKNPKLVVQTLDGRELPVSRSQMPAVRSRWGNRIRNS